VNACVSYGLVNEEELHQAVFRVAERRGYDRHPGALGPLVRLLSDAYNAGGTAQAIEHGQARLLFSVPRDAPKSEAAVGELIAAGLLQLTPEKPLSVLDVGAGLGASTWGLALALAKRGMRGEIHATFVDDDVHALALADDLHRAMRFADITVRVQKLAKSGKSLINAATANAARKVGDSGKPGKPGKPGQGQRPGGQGLAVGPQYDLVLMGQVLSEVSADADELARLAEHETWIRALLTQVAPGGALVIVEPALRTRTRHLHKLRARFSEQVFAPCLQRDACPMLERENDWCHEDLPKNLPEWLVPVARAAGLRYEGLTFSYLVLRPDGRGLRESVPHGSVRAVSSLRKSKGKSELLVCGPGAPLSMMRLDRHRTEANAAWETIARGALFRAETPVQPADGSVDSTIHASAATEDEGTQATQARSGRILPQTRVQIFGQTARMRGLYPIVDLTLLAARGIEPLAFARAVLALSPSLLQLRAKDSSDAEIERVARALLPLAAAQGTALVINDRADIAARVGAAFVHLGQADASIQSVRRAFPSLRIGCSTHSLEQFKVALAEGADYVAIGPIFATQTKVDAAPPVGLSVLEAVAGLAGATPIVAIGGIDAERCSAVAQYASMAAVISALLPAELMPATHGLETVTSAARALHQHWSAR
jgi:thiamine-phosphate diphosphorylase